MLYFLGVWLHMQLIHQDFNPWSRGCGSLQLMFLPPTQPMHLLNYENTESKRGNNQSRHTSNVQKEKQSLQYKCTEIKHSHSLLKQYFIFFKISVTNTIEKKN